MASCNSHIYMTNHNVGAHVGFNGNLSHSLLFAISNGMYTCQIFVGDELSLRRADVSIADIFECQKIQARFPVHFFSHFPFNGSLCGSVQSLAWNGDQTQNRKTEFVLLM